MDLRLSIAVLLWFLLFGISVYPVYKKGDYTQKDWRNTFLAFCITLCISLIVWRLRSLQYNGEINVDESTTIAIAQKYLNDPVPWRSVDSVTCGPLSSWVALWAPIIGVPLGYLPLRLTGLALIFLCGSGTALTMREIVGNRLAFLVTLPALTLLLTTLNFDFVTFAMEYLPMAMGVWAIYYTLRQFRTPSHLNGFLVGTLTGGMPFSKLQSAPIAVFIFLICAGIIFYQNKSSRPTCIRAMLWISAGGLLIPTLILVPVIMAGAWSYFLNFYIFCGATYKSSGPQISALTFLTKGSDDFGLYFLATFIVSIISLFFVREQKDKTRIRTWLIGAAIVSSNFLLTVFCVMKSGFNFPHYLLLLVFPLSLILAWCLKALLQFASTQLPESKRLRLGFYAISVILAAQGLNVYVQYSKTPQFLKNWGSEQNPIAPVIKQFAKPGDSMAIWGWYNKLHVFSGIRPASRFIGTTYVTDPSPNYNQHRDVFLSDLKEDKPRLFVDAVDEFRWPTWPPGALARHEMFPALAEYIRENYKLVAEGATAPNRVPVRIYLRKEP